MNLYYFYIHYLLWLLIYLDDWFLKWVRQTLLSREYLPLWWWFQADFRLNLRKHAALCPWFWPIRLDFLVSINAFFGFWQSWTHALTINDRNRRRFLPFVLNSLNFKQFSFDFAENIFVSESSEMVINGLPGSIILGQ